MTASKIFLLFAVLTIRVSAAPANDPTALEARLKEAAETSPTGANLMLELVDLYAKNGQVFGLIRTAGKFSRAQSEHPRRAEVMLKLIEGYAATARHEDVITTCRQFQEIFPIHPLSNQVRERLATAYGRTGRKSLAAAQLSDAWTNGGGADAGIEALRLRMEENNATGFKEATALSIAMVEALPADATLTDIAFQGMEAASRAEQWAEGLQIAKILLRRNAPLGADEKRKLESYEGVFQARLGQHGNAVDSFRAALSPGDAETHSSLIAAMISAKKPIAEIEAEARRYLAAFPQREDRYAPLARTAHASAEPGDTSKAAAIAAEVIRHDVESHDIPRAFVSWCGDDHARAEKGLIDAISANSAGAAKLRAVLALELYRDRMKNPAKARAMARSYLANRPTEDGWAEGIAKCLYDSAADDTAFRDDLAAVVASANAYPHLFGFQENVWKPAPSDKNRSREWQKVKKDFQNDAVTRLWRQTREDGGKAGQSCKELLQIQWSEDARHYLLSRLAYVYRHHLGGKSKEVSPQHYETLCKAFPKDIEAAARWLEAAQYGKPEMITKAANHLLTIPPAEAHPDTWVRFVDTKDEAIIRKALPWIEASLKFNNHKLYQSARIGDILNDAGMEKEALALWKSRMDIDPNNSDAVTCALRVASKMEPA